jgi:uncharacterized protein (TIGR03089 family)
MTPEQLFSDLLAAEPSRPFVTYYDEASGERSELSVRSLANWVAKTHFLLLDELGLGVGDGAYVSLPAHWLSVPAVLGALTAGLELTSDAARAAVAFVAADTAASAQGVPDVYSIDAAPGIADYTTAVRPQQDKWPAVHLRAGADDPGLDERSREAVVAAARARANDLGATAGARLLTTRSWHSTDDLVDTLLVPLVIGGSIVYVVNAPDDALIERRMQQERATVRV